MGGADRLRHLLLTVIAVGAANPAHAAVQIAQSRHFTVYSDDRPDAVRAFADRLERFDKAVRFALKLPDDGANPAIRLTVFVVPSLDDVRRVAGTSDITRIYLAQAPGGPVAFFPRRTPNDQSRRTPSPLMVLQHDYARQIIDASLGARAIPAWLDAGLAEFFATARVRDDGSVLLGAIPEYRWDGVDRAVAFPVSRLVRTGPNYADRQEANIYAGRSWLLIHYMIFDPGRAKLLDTYIAAVKAGRAPNDAAAILDAGDGLDKKLDAYGARAMWASAVLAADLLPIGDTSVRALTPAEADAPRGLCQSKCTDR